jgi:hypothetical protein
VHDSIDFPVVAAEPEADGGALLMRDISDTLVGSQMHGGLRPRWASTIGVGSCGPPDDRTPRSAGSSSPMRVGWRTGS